MFTQSKTYVLTLSIPTAHGSGSERTPCMCVLDGLRSDDVDDCALYLALLASTQTGEPAVGPDVRLSLLVRGQECAAEVWTAATRAGGTYSAFSDELTAHAIGQSHLDAIAA